MLCADLSFQYRDPFQGFDRSAVKGVMARLVKVPDLANATALEVSLFVNTREPSLLNTFQSQENIISDPDKLRCL